MAATIEIWGVHDPNISAQLVLAHKLDLFKREAGLDVTCKFIESGTTMANDVVQANPPPFAVTQTPITALLLRERGMSTKLVAPLADIAGTQQVVIRNTSGISAPADLQGKRIGMARGAAIYLALQHMAKDCHVKLDEVEFMNLLPHEQIDAFRAGTLDAIASWEPWTTQAQRMGGVFYFSGTQSKIPGMEGDINWLINQSCLIVPDEHVQQHPDIVIALLNVLRKATDLLNHHRKNVADVLTGFFGINRLDLLFALQKNTYSLMVTNLFKLGILEFRDFLYDNGKISAKFPTEQLFDASLLQQVDRSLVFLEDTAAQNVPIVKVDGIYYREDFVLPSNGAPLEFLIADDSRFVRSTLARAVAKIGGRIVAEVTTGSEVLETFAYMRSDVITMDLSMPGGVSGIEAIKIVLQIDPNVNVIVISGIDLDEVRKELFDLGVKMFITKPFQIEAVTDVLRTLVQPAEL
jgi:ABC-type nitrate/sulfonate/bicarbonate transport system substrate-binding protein/ActR/RegA family two-component response regulator